ncbi:MAG: small multidrug resistance protein, partial [Clostridiales bacterium]|nr:small multidrug resistance protein [Clostridiales bacterium]
MKWLALIIAGLFEVGWALGLKYSQGFTKLVPSIFTIAGMIASFYFLSLALKSLPLGTAYAIWTGIGTVGTVTLGIIIFKEPFDVTRLIC